MQSILLAAGYATRLYPLTKNRPKPLLKVADKAIADYILDKIMALAQKYNLFVIEDCAEAHGAEYKGRKVGSFGDIACFSFYGNKIITTGEGGICITNNEKLAERMNLLKNHGADQKKKYWHPIVGYNYRMTNVQAAIGLAQLERVQEFLEKREKNTQLYNSLLKKINGITLSTQKENTKNVTWLYPILIEEKFGLTRDQIIEKLGDAGIESRPFFYPINEMPPYTNNEQFITSKELSSKGINLPSSTNLTEDQIDYICKQITLLGKNGEI